MVYMIAYVLSPVKDTFSPLQIFGICFVMASQDQRKKRKEIYAGESVSIKTGER